MQNIITKSKLSWKAQTIGGVFSVFAAVAIPQLLHLLGAASGLGTSLGEIFLPMHLPIILAGLLIGPYAAGVAGFFSPLISYLLTGMPSSVMLPFMMIELAAYGILAGVLKNRNIPEILKVLFVQILGRLIRAAAIFVGFYALGTAIKPAVILSSVKIGLIGIALQLIIIPLAVYRLKNVDHE